MLNFDNRINKQNKIAEKAEMGGRKMNKKIVGIIIAISLILVGSFLEYKIFENSDISSWIVFVGIMAIIILIPINLFCLPYLIREMAKRDFIFTTVNEGTAKAVMGAGGSGFQRFIFHFKGHRLNDPNKNDFDPNKPAWEVIPEDAPAHKIDKLIKFFGLSGVSILGFPGMQTVHKYKFRWNSLKQSPDQNTQESGGIYYTPHDEELNYVILQSDAYYARIESAEDKDMVPLDFDIILRGRVTNPYKALFVAQEWLEMTWSIYLSEFRRFIAQKKWQKLSQKAEAAESKYAEHIQNEVALLSNSFGTTIDEFRILRIRPGGKRAEMYEEAATKQFEAEREAKKIITLAKAKAGEIEKVYGKIQEFGELGELIYRLESAVKASQGSGTFILSIPELAGLGRAVQSIASPKKP